MKLCRFIPNPDKLGGQRTMLLILVVVVLYKSHTCQGKGRCQPSYDEMLDMCLIPPPKKAQVDILLKSKMTRSRVNVKDCPNTCFCRYIRNIRMNVLVISHCNVDPRHDLPKLFRHYTEVNYLELLFYNAALSTFPCEISILTRLKYMFIHESPMQTISCNLSALTEFIGLAILQTRLQTVPSELFTTLPSLSYLHLAYNAIDTVSVPSSGSFKLQLLRLNNNQIATFPKGILGLSSLRVLDLGNNKLRTLPQLSPLSSMMWLNLTNNPLGNLDLNLSNLRGLRCLDLSKTKMSHINRTQLPPTLVSLQLSHNNLTTLPDCDLSGLLYLDISHNRLKMIPSLVWRTQVTGLDLCHNEMTSLYRSSMGQRLACLDQSYNKICDIAYQPVMPLSIKTLFLDHNKIARMVFFGDPHSLLLLVYVDLSHNMLTNLDSWPLRLGHINPTIQVDIDSNSIQTFTNSGGEAWFKSCNTIMSGKISLKHNKISHIMDVFNGWNLTGHTLDQLQTCLNKVPLQLNGNPVVCDCVDYEIYRHIHESKHWDLSCSQPERLHGRDPLNVPLDAFICPVYEDCPKGCTCVKSPHTKSIQLVCDHYTGRDLPTVIPQLPEGSTYHLNFKNRNLQKVSFKGYLWKSSRALFSHNAITEISKEVLLELVNVEVVHLDNNLLVRLSEDIMRVTLSMTRELTLSNNLWLCDCPALAMHKWVMQNAIKIPDANSIMCNAPKSTRNKKMLLLESSSFCPKPMSIPLIVLTSAAPIAAVIFIISMVRKYWQHHEPAAPLIGQHLDPVPGVKLFKLPPRDECEGEEKEFDVYVAYDDRDEDYILQWLMPELEKRGFKVCSQRANADWYMSEMENISMLMNISKRVLVFFTNNMIDGGIGLYEWNTAYHLDIRDGRTRLVTVLDRDVDMNDLDDIQREYFSMCASVVRGEEHFWRNLIYLLAIERMGGQATVRDEGEV